MSITPFKDNGKVTLPDTLTEKELSALAKIANRPVGKLIEANPDLLVFPHCLGNNKDNISFLPIFSLYDKTLKTGNIVGFCGVNGVNVHIHSRFDSNEKQYFLHYMLQKVFGINMLNLPTTTNDESIWDFLLYLFPFCLKKAMRQGLFRTYRTFHYNDDKMKGAIDVPAHIQCNVPFAGRIAYQAREYTANNHLIHLVRHTIEAIRHHPLAGHLLSNDQETRRCIENITIATPDFNSRELNKIMLKNLRSVCHPFYTEYTLLQQLCLKILRHERLTYGEEEEDIHGILFDASWLWEEYLATILCSVDSNAGLFRFQHPQNKNGSGALDFYTGEDGLHYKGAIPDFYNDGFGVVIDAKYKPLERKLRTNDLREDRFQLIGYMHIQKAQIGLLLYPSPPTTAPQPQWEGTLRGYGGKVGIFGICIPDNTDSLASFAAEMDSSGGTITRFLNDTIRPLSLG